MKSVWRLIDHTLGRWLRHFAFLLVRAYYALFYNVSCSNRHLIQDLPGALLLSTHVSRHDGPLVTAVLYSTRRVRPAVHYNEYTHWAQWFPLMLGSAIPMSSPKSWTPERRAERKEYALGVIRKVIAAGNLVLLFPAGHTKRQSREIIAPKFSGAYDTLKAVPDCPVVLIRIGGLSKFDTPIYDLFWTFLGRRKGRRHVNIQIERLDDGLDTSVPLEEFNARLEDLLNE